MQTLAFLWFDLQVAQQSLRESFVESPVPAKAGWLLGLYGEGEFMKLLRMFFAPIVALGLALTASARDYSDLAGEGYRRVSMAHTRALRKRICGR